MTWAVGGEMLRYTQHDKGGRKKQKPGFPITNVGDDMVGNG